MTAYFYTIGCKVNQYESAAMAETLENNGFVCQGKSENAEVIVVNSCTVTAESSRKTRQAVRRFRAMNKNAVILLTGCMVQAFPKMAAELEEADVVIGNTDFFKVVDAIKTFLKTKQRIVLVEEHKKGEKYCDIGAKRFGEHTRAYMKIEDGCDRFCSYCIIPYARGRVRSRSLESIKSEAEKQAANGYKEVVLVGINLSSYGKDTGLELCDAVEAVAKVEKIKRVRLGSLECDLISDAALDRLAGCEKFCPQFHLSLQSGSDKTLKEMNRRYDTAFYEDLVRRIRERFENAAITTDIMVGFSGESEEDFLESLAFVERIGFARTHIFTYSVREGTKAALRTDLIDAKVKQVRSEKMKAVSNVSEAKFLSSQIGRVLNVLVEERINGYWEGYSENYTRVKFISEDILQGKIVPVKIIGTDGNVCVGNIK